MSIKMIALQTKRYDTFARSMPARFFLFIILAVSLQAHAQKDSLRTTDSAHGRSATASPATDTVKADPAKAIATEPALTWQQDTAFNRFFINKKFPKDKQSVFAINAVRQPLHEDGQFYMIIGLLCFAGIIRALFPKYFNTLLQSFFRSQQRQKYIKENAAQDAFPSFLLNLLFAGSGGLLLAVFIREDDVFRYISFPLVWLYAGAALAAVYLVKSFFITLFGWAFDEREATGTYRFIVFMVNKVAGLCFIPLLLVLLYATETSEGFQTASTVSLFAVSGLLLYRYIVSLSLVGKKLKIYPLHFFLYLCAVEILPLLITYKVLLITREL